MRQSPSHIHLHKDGFINPSYRRLRPWKRTLSERYYVKRDIILVKEEDEKDLQRYATGVAFRL